MTILMCMKVGPKIVPFMRARDLQEGERLTLTCTVSKGDTPISLQWSRNGTPLNNNPTPNQAGIKVINVDQFSSMLAIARFAQSHTWTFVHFKSRPRYFLFVWKLYGRLMQPWLIFDFGQAQFWSTRKFYYKCDFFAKPLHCQFGAGARWKLFLPSPERSRSCYLQPSNQNQWYITYIWCSRSIAATPKYQHINYIVRTDTSHMNC